MDDSRQDQEHLGTLFQRLRGALEASRIVVHLNTRTFSHELDLYGSFSPRGNPRTWIGDVQVFRTREDVAGDPVDELLTLAHEAGHAISFMRGLSSDQYREVVGKVPHDGVTLPAASKALVLNEEARAWVLARNELTALSFDSWSSYADRTAKSLARYGDLLAISVGVEELLLEQTKELSSQGLIGLSNLRPTK